MFPNHLSPFKPDELVQRWLADSTLQRGCPEWQVPGPQSERLPNQLEGLSVPGVPWQNLDGHVPLEDEVPIKRTASNTDYPDPSEKYVRRQRNKTRHDRYELRETKSRWSKRSSKIKSVHRSPAESKEVFHAPNVHTERLTLKPILGPGIFAKGKSSVPVELQGLPDLTFSEMKFLSRIREHSGRHFKGNSDNVAFKRTKEMPSEEISRFFSRPGEKSASPKSKKVQPIQFSATVSPTCDTRGDFARAETTGRHARTAGSLGQKSCSRSISSKQASSISWSKSPPDHNHHLGEEHSHLNPDLPETSTAPRLQGYGSHCGASRTPTIHPMSSASNHLLKEFTDNVLLSDIRNWSQPNKQYLSLEDLKRLAMKTAEHETVSLGDGLHLFDRISILEACPQTTNHPLHDYKFNKTLVNKVSRLPEDSAPDPARARGRSGMEEQLSQALIRHLDQPLEPQSVAFRLSMQDDLDFQLDDRLLEGLAGQTLPVDADTSAQRAPALDSIFQGIQSPRCEELARSDHINTFRDYETPLYDPGHDSDSLDPFDLQLLGVDHSGGRVSPGLMDGNRLTSQGLATAADLTYLPRLSGNPTASDTVNAGGTLSHPNIDNCGLEDCLLMQPPNSKPIAHPLGNRLGLISRRPEEPLEEVFTGLSRPYILY